MSELDLAEAMFTSGPWRGLEMFLRWRFERLPERRQLGAGVLVKLDKLIAHAQLHTKSHEQGGQNRIVWADAVQVILFPSGAHRIDVSAADR